MRRTTPLKPREIRKAVRNAKSAVQAPSPTKSGGIPTLSLFSGAGGLDLGFVKSGFDIVACVEIERAYCETLRANVGGQEGYGATTVVHQIDIRKFDPRAYLGAGIRCVIGGPPCQTFSAAGRRAGGVIGTEDERGQLFQAYCDVLDILKPEVFVFENVYGLPGANGGGPWREIRAAFEERGYGLQAEVVDAADYGVPQHRERLIMVGSLRDSFKFPKPTHGPDAENGVSLVSVETAIADLQDPAEPFHDELGGMYGHLLPLVPEGLNYSYFTAEMNHPAPVFAWRSKFHDLLYKVDRNAPCRTLKAQPGKFTGPFHWKNRHFTTAELKRLQTFPDHYVLTGRAGSVIEQIGNSVPPRLAEVVAVSVKEQLLERVSKLTYPIREAGFTSTFRQRQRKKTAHFHSTAKASNAGAGNQVAQQSPGALGTYYIRAEDLFDRRQLKRPQGVTKKALRVNVSERGRHIELEIARADGLQLPESRIEITGLRKYLPDYDSLTAIARVAELAEVFHVWAAVEEALIARSRFFTLIDIYGHYANRGDTVQIDGTWKIDVPAPVLRLLNFTSKTMNCGQFISLTTLTKSAGIPEERIPSLVEALRAVRFDARTRFTHPIIKDDVVLCTYPFPLLSPRALVESRARVTRTDSQSDVQLARVG
jgi:DNA (cytosine-5)-methyltransferase 1